MRAMRVQKRNVLFSMCRHTDLCVIVCVCMEEKESMDVNNTYMTLNTETNVRIDGKHHENRDSKKKIGTQTMTKCEKSDVICE